MLAGVENSWMVDGSADVGSFPGAPAGVYGHIMAAECPESGPKVVGNQPYCHDRRKDSRWVSDVYYSAWIDYTWT